jgi:ion channel-forming bestrophin family protein
MGPPAAHFWREAWAIEGSITPHVAGLVVAFGAYAAAVMAVAAYAEQAYGVEIGVTIAPYEVAGAILGLLLVLRTNAGYDRWWEARRLWGGIVNQSRNLALTALAYGPRDPAWRDDMVRWTVAFAHAARRSLRGERELHEVAALLGPVAADTLAAADHPPSAAAAHLAALLRRAADAGELSGWAFQQADRERAALIDHVGGCERILKTPLPDVYAINIRRFLLLFLAALPFALLHKLEPAGLTPVATMLVAYPLLSLDRIGAELQNPFSTGAVNHLPLDDICATIERNLLALAAAAQ